MGQPLTICRECKTTSECYHCIALLNWIIEHNDPKWISVKERMPKKYQTVIVHAQHAKKWRNRLPIEYSWHVVEEDIWLGDNWCNNEDQNFREVTHWMPMPEPPKEEL